jgi:hypothetical protein
VKKGGENVLSVRQNTHGEERRGKRGTDLSSRSKGYKGRIYAVPNELAGWLAS